MQWIIGFHTPRARSLEEKGGDIIPFLNGLVWGDAGAIRCEILSRTTIEQTPMLRREYKLPLQFTDYRIFGVTEDFVKYLLNIGWTIHRNEIVASQLVIAAFLYMQSRVAQLEGRTRKRVGKATKIVLDHPQIVQKLVFELSEKIEMAQEETQICDVSTLLIRYIKDLVSFYLEHNSYYVVVGQTRYFLDYAPRYLEILDRNVAPDLMRGGDKQLARAQKQIYAELERRFKDQLKKSNDGRRKYAFELLKNPDLYVNLVKETLSRFNLWVSPPGTRQDRIGKHVHKYMGQAEVDRYHTLLDFDALMDLIRRLSLPNPYNCWALPDFCLAANGDPTPNPDPPAWTDKELKAIEDTITVTLARRQAASVMNLSVLIDGKERYSFSPRKTKSISFDLNKSEKLIEVISHEPGGDLPLAAYLMNYDEESYDRKWSIFGERRLTSTVILEGGQKVRFIVSVTKNAEQEATGARIMVCFQFPSLLRRTAQWWENIHQPVHTTMETRPAADISETTRLLKAWSEGDQMALERLVPLVDADLRRLARHYLHMEQPGHILQTTALVNETWMRLIEGTDVSWQNHAHFIGMAALLMRRILVDEARRRRAQRHGADAVLADAEGIVPEKGADLVALDEALNELAKFDERQSKIVELHFFVGLSLKETAEALNISQRQVQLEWKLAQEWLYRELSGSRARSWPRKAR